LEEFNMRDDPLSAGNCVWTDLENAVCETANMAFMLEATLETDSEFYGERRTAAIAFGIYEVAERARTAQEFYSKLHEAVHEARPDDEDSTFADASKPKKVVHLH
jgi:hypothetical protein